MSTSDPSHYQAFLLRLWRDSDDAPWRAMVQDTRTGERHTFPTLWGLLLFIETHTGTVISTDRPEEEG